MDKLNISEESKPAANLLRKLPGESEEDISDSPARMFPSLAALMTGFYVNHAKHGPGHLIIYPPALCPFSPARIQFTTIRSVPASRNLPIDPSASPSSGDLIISINDVIAMKKTGLGRIASYAVSWALDAQDAGGTGLELTIIRRDKEGGKTGVEKYGKTEKVELKKIVRRDELFDRLLTIGEQRWELL